QRRREKLNARNNEARSRSTGIREPEPPATTTIRPDRNHGAFSEAGSRASVNAPALYEYSQDLRPRNDPNRMQRSDLALEMMCYLWVELGADDQKNFVDWAINHVLLEPPSDSQHLPKVLEAN